MLLSKRHRWTLVAGLASIVGVQLTEQLLSSAWRLARRKDPPYDPGFDDVSWKSAIFWTAGVGALAGLSDLVARRGAGLAWYRATGTKPPRPRRRPRR
jgi:hypothetical protein